MNNTVHIKDERKKKFRPKAANKFKDEHKSQKLKKYHRSKPRLQVDGPGYRND